VALFAVCVALFAVRVALFAVRCSLRARAGRWSPRAGRWSLIASRCSLARREIFGAHSHFNMAGALAVPVEGWMSIVNDEMVSGRWWIAQALFACALASSALAQDARPAASLPAPASAPVPVASAPAPPSAAATVAPAAEPHPAEPPVIEGVVAATAPAPRSWFWRPPLRLEMGEGRDRWSFTVFGFVEADYIFDSTRSYDDAIGGALVARSDTYAGHASRSQFSVRNSRLGFVFTSPNLGGVRGSAVVEADFFGNQAASAPEHALFDSPAFRLRHAYLQLQSAYVDVIAGHTYTVFGWQNYFSPCSLEFLGIPNQLFSRATQLRASHAFDLGGDLSLDVAIAAARPAQRDSGVPDAHAGVRLRMNDWKGIATPGNTGTLALPLSIGVSGTVRQFKVNAFTPPPTQRSNSATGWGLSFDALVPVIPAADVDDRANRLTFTGSFVTGTGIADLITSGGGASFPTLPNPAQANPPPLYTADIDNGLVSFDTQGVMHTIDWWAMRFGLQYYLPPSGRLIVSANYTQSRSGNMRELFPKGGAEIELLARVADRSHYVDLNLMWDATPAIRLGISGQYTKVIYLDGDTPHNVRVMGQALYVF
jgi:hypothetical protein